MFSESQVFLNPGTEDRALRKDGEGRRQSATSIASAPCRRPGFHGWDRGAPGRTWTRRCDRTPAFPATHLQLFVLQLLSRGHGRRFLLYLMAVELISGSWKIFVLHGLAKLSAPRTLTAVAASPKHTVVTPEECDSWTAVLILFSFFVNHL